MKKFIFTMIVAVMAAIGANAQTPKTFIEEGGGVFVPTDGSHVFYGETVGVGHYFTPMFGVGLQANYGTNNLVDKNDLGLVAVNGLAKVLSNRLMDIDVKAGIGYGWHNVKYTVIEQGYLYYLKDERESNASYIVPKVGVDVAFNILKSHKLQLVVSPEYSWYNVTEKEDFKNVGIFSVLGKVRFNF